MLAENAGRRPAIGFSFRHSPTDGDPDMAFSRAFIIVFCVATAVAILVRRFTVPDTHEEMSNEVATRLLRLDAGEFDDPADLLGGAAEAPGSRSGATPLDSHR